jgi:Ser/Thr protein kinase RdoA (MazF antagonist)
VTVEDEVVFAWDWNAEPVLVPCSTGLINQTFEVHVAGAPAGVLQRLNTSIFDPCVHEDIRAVTEHLARRGVATPRLRETRQRELFYRTANGEVWRVSTFIGDRTVLTLHSHEEVRSAGRLVGAFHSATRDLDWRFRHVRGGFHDTPGRMSDLDRALALGSAHRLYDRVARLADEIFADWNSWSGGGNLPQRIVHGDLKAANVRFDGSVAVALVDLDTLGHGTLDAELGDAFRSWCNPAREDASGACFDLDILEHALAGYAEAGGRELLTAPEREAIVTGVERIALELAARFAADALEERYFGWEPRFGTRGDHNLVRAETQLALARSVRARRSLAEARVARVFGA